jgi:thioredoxin-related protein
MNNYCRIIICLILLICLVSYQNKKYHQEKIVVVPRTTPTVSIVINSIVYDYSKGLELSKKLSKPLLVVLKNDSCKYCKILSDDINKLKLLDYFIVCFIDTESDHELSKQFKYNVVPTSILIDCSGEKNLELSRKEGYKYEKYKDWLQSINTNYTNDH